MLRLAVILVGAGVSRDGVHPDNIFASAGQIAGNARSHRVRV